VCVCILESGRNKTQLAGKNTHCEEEKNTRQAFGELVSGYFHPCKEWMSKETCHKTGEIKSLWSEGCANTNKNNISPYAWKLIK
jgi:hypothetical protein